MQLAPLSSAFTPESSSSSLVSCRAPRRSGSSTLARKADASQTLPVTKLGSIEQLVE